MRIDDKKLRKFLDDTDLFSTGVLDQAEKEAQEKNIKLGKVLLEKKLINQERLSKIYAYLLGIPFVDLEERLIDSETLKIIPEAIAKAHNIIAFKKNSSNIEVAMLDPEDLETIGFITKKSGLTVLPRLTSKKSIIAGLKQYQRTLESELKALSKGFGSGLNIMKEGSDGSEEKIQQGKELERIANNIPIIKIVDTILKHAIIKGASDIHIEPEEKEVIVRYRIDGILRKTITLPKNTHTGLTARVKVLSNLKLDEHRLPQDGRFKIETAEYKVAFRVSILPIMDGEKIVMRLLQEGTQGLTLEKLGLRGQALEKIYRAISRPHGMLLITGPTGSGKTTTLYTCLDILNKPEVNITTIEDPIEYHIEHINQTQIKPNIGFDFANGLRSIVRQDPDIIMVGEIRDKETAKISANAALTGHLLLSTLHTNDAATTITRLEDFDIEPFLIASTLNLAVAQRLVRRISPKANIKKYTLDEKQIQALEKELPMSEMLKMLKKEGVIKEKTTWSEVEFSKPEGEENDYKGRLGIYEVLEVTDEIREMITRQSTASEINKKAREQGMLGMMEDGFIKAVQGLTTIDELMRVTKD